MIDPRYSNRAHADLVFVNMMELIKLHALMHREPAAPACVICSSNQLRYGLFGHILLLIIILIPKLSIFYYLCPVWTLWPYSIFFIPKLDIY